MTPDPGAGPGIGTLGAPLEVAVVGGGIAGLAAAARLRDLGRERGVPTLVTLFEGAARAGGVIRTERVDGFIIEAGPDCFITDKPWGVDLCRRLGLEGELVGTNPDCRRSYVLRGRRLMPVPDGFYMMAPARLWPFATSSILSPAGRLRAALDLVLPRGPAVPDESLASFVRRRFGSEVLERIAQPLVAGIYNADPEHLSLRATMPRFLDLERTHRSVIAGLMRMRRRPGGTAGGVSGARYSLFVTPRRGMESIVEKLIQGMPGESLRLQTPVAGIQPTAPDSATPGRHRFRLRTARGETLAFHAVVLALPAGPAAAVLRDADAAIAELLAGIRYGGSTTVSLAWRADDLPKLPAGFGFVVPRSENRKLIACSFSSIKFPDRAPAGQVLLRAFAAGAPEAESDPAQVVAAVRAELRELLGIEATPHLTRVFFYPDSMPQYAVGHLARVAEIESRLERHVGLAVAGNGLRGVGMPDCVRSGEAAAERILSQAALLVS